MSQVTQPTITSPVHSRRAILLAGLLALIAAAAIVLVLALSDDSGVTEAGAGSAQAQPSLRSGGGPEETGVAASVGTRPAPGPDESSVATAVSPTGGTGLTASERPDESRVAASVSGR